MFIVSDFFSALIRLHLEMLVAENCFLIYDEIQVHCNVFEGSMGDISLTAGGGRRYLPITSNYEEVAMVSIMLRPSLFLTLCVKAPNSVLLQ
jgi:hypothetical protein